MMRANGIDVYVDLVENQRDGDDGHFNFVYADAFGNKQGGRFPKGPIDFHPHVWFGYQYPGNGTEFGDGVWSRRRRIALFRIRRPDERACRVAGSTSGVRRNCL